MTNKPSNLKRAITEWMEENDHDIEGMKKDFKESGLRDSHIADLLSYLADMLLIDFEVIERSSDGDYWMEAGIGLQLSRYYWIVFNHEVVLDFDTLDDLVWRIEQIQAQAVDTLKEFKKYTGGKK